MRGSLRVSVLVGFMGLAFTSSFALADAQVVAPTDSSFLLPCVQGDRALRARQIRFDDLLSVADYDSTTHCLVVELRTRIETHSSSITDDQSEDWYSRLIAWDVPNQRVAWTRERPRRLVTAVDGRVVLANAASSEILDGVTGRTIRTIPAPISAHADGRLLLSLDHDRIRRYDLRSGEERWDVAVDGLGSRARVFQLAGSPYVLGGGLTRIDSENGGGWHLAADLGRNRTLTNTVGNLIGYASVLLTRVAAGRGQPWRSDVRELYGLPREDGGELFFAADSEAMRIDAQTGSARWRRTIEFDPRERERRRAMGLPVSTRRTPGQMCLRPGASDLGIVSMGYAVLNDRWALSDPPAITLLDRESGRWLRGARLDTTQIVTGYVRLAQGHYVACDGRRVTRFGEDLRSLASFTWPSGPVSLLGLLAADSCLLAVTSNELMELDPIALTARWAVPLGPGISRSGAQHWYSGDRGLLRWDPADPGAPRRFFALRSAASRLRDGVVTTWLGDQATLVWLDESTAPDLDPD